MYDPLKASYRFSCPRRGHESVSLSDFRTIERLPGARTPAVFQVVFACPCGDSHPGLVSDHDLDWAPVGTSFGAFANLMTSKFEEESSDALQIAAQKIKAGSWPWSFYCYAENQIKPASPSSFVALAPSEGHYGLLVRCLSCQTMSVNLVSQPHLDIPFYNDSKVAVVEHVFAGDSDAIVSSFADDLWSGRFDANWQDLSW
jgi:hypothetical protein